eukprot:TRINITY_DN8603_c0_g1_i1.p1 TRINITY_DN8603_c0_g1~~TRINITY_DN8603_c0_g1_i1.p1  ORF type:complete len:727 (+),score=168.33 TRINITY_DN8603_c0_g1_i1:90-2183(+)
MGIRRALVPALGACLCAPAATGFDAATAEQRDIVVLGAGPAGVQVAHSLSKLGEDFVVLERAPHAGSYFDKFPINRKLISINKVHTSNPDPDFQLRHDWNSLLGAPGARRFTNYTKELWPHAELIPQYLEGFIAEHKLGPHIRFNTEATRVSRDASSGRFHIRTSSGTDISAAVLVVATGRWVPNNLANIYGWDDVAVPYQDIPQDPAVFEGKKVLIIGAGNSAMEVADAIEESASVVHIVARRSLRFAHQTHYVGDLRAVNLRTLDRYLLKSEEVLITSFELATVHSLYPGAETDGEPPETVASKVPDSKKKENDVWFEFQRLDDGRVSLIGRKFTKSEKNGSWSIEHKEIPALRHPYDFVFHCIGWRPNLTIFTDTALPEMAHGGAFPRVTTAYESVNIPNMFFAGALGHGRDYRISSGGFIHGFRYLANALPHVIAMRRHDKEWPYDTLPCHLEHLLKRIRQRIASSSSMYQMFSFMGDAIFFPDEAARKAKDAPCELRYYQDVPLELLTSGVLTFGPPDATYLELSMDWSPQFRGSRVVAHVNQNQEERRDEADHFPLQSGTEDDEYAERFLGKATPTGQDAGSDEGSEESQDRWSGDKFLHPILRLYRRRRMGPDGSPRSDGARHPELLASHHVGEDVWTTFDHYKSMVRPLRKFMKREITPLFPATDQVIKKREGVCHTKEDCEATDQAED